MVAKLIDLSGRRFGKWHVVGHAGVRNGRLHTWHALCDCGEPGVVLGGNLRSGGSTQCRSCARRERLAARAAAKVRQFASSPVKTDIAPSFHMETGNGAALSAKTE
jgi:hypothetical protein